MSVIKTAHEGLRTATGSGTRHRWDSANPKLMPNSPWPTDELGVTTLTRTWQVRTEDAADFLPNYGDRDEDFPTLRYVSAEPVDQGGLSIIAERYNGFLPRVQRPVIERKFYRKEEVTLHNTEGSFTFVYLTQVRLRRWATDREPVLKDYFEDATFNGKASFLYAKTTTGQTISDQSDLALLLKRFSYQVKAKRTQFDAVPDGHVIRVMEEVAMMVVQTVTGGFDLLRNV